MNTYTYNDIRHGKMFSDGKNLIYEVEHFVYSTDANPEFVSLTVEVYEYSTVSLKFENRGIKDVRLAELRPIPDRIEFDRIQEYNN